MTAKIAIIGLGQIGASIGQALALHKDQVNTIGYDTSSVVARAAQQMGAVDQLGHTLSATIKDADVIVLALPFDQIHETLRSIEKDARDGAVVMDTAPGKQAVATWAKELIYSKCHYVGLTPAINALALEETSVGIDAARADLFQKGLVAVTAPYGSDEGAIQLATSFVSLLGARAYFADMAEVDGIMARVHSLPALAAAALAETVISQPGWGDIRKLAGRPFVTGMRPLDEQDPAALAKTAHMNRANVVRVLEDYITALKSLRDEIEADKKGSLEARLGRILNARDQWRRIRADGDWQAIESAGPEMPSFGELWKRQFGGLGKLFGRRGKPTEDD